MRDFLLDDRQPFGVVEEYKVMPGAPCDYGYSSKPLGANTVRTNNGATEVKSLSDRAPDALSYAHRNLGDPFAWTGRPGR